MKERVRIPWLVCVIAALLSGCASTGSEPKKVLSRYFEASVDNRYEDAYQYICEKDRVVMSLEDYISSREDKWMLDSETLRSKISYKVKEVEVIGDRAQARVEVTMPDMVAIATDIFGAVLTSIFEDENSRRELEEELESKYARGRMPVTTKTRYYNLVKDPEGWRVCFDREAEED